MPLRHSVISFTSNVRRFTYLILILSKQLPSEAFLNHYVEEAETMVIAAPEGPRNKEENYLQIELSSLGIECKRKNEINDKEELEGLTTAIK
ncbi:MAG: hypothetical protein M3258_08075, partial [Thermoproteota archaeon]|nr:hypothetical protein [Thermoproteota archaeon]